MTHAHRWLIDTPTPGVAYLPGVCRECGSEREFPAHLDALEGNWLEKYAKRRRTQPRVARQGGDR